MVHLKFSGLPNFVFESCSFDETTITLDGDERFKSSNSRFVNKTKSKSKLEINFRPVYKVQSTDTIPIIVFYIYETG